MRRDYVGYGCGMWVGVLWGVGVSAGGAALPYNFQTKSI